MYSASAGKGSIYAGKPVIVTGFALATTLIPHARASDLTRHTSGATAANTQDDSERTQTTHSMYARASDHARMLQPAARCYTNMRGACLASTACKLRAGNAHAQYLSPTQPPAARSPANCSCESCKGCSSQVPGIESTLVQILSCKGHLPKNPQVALALSTSWFRRLFCLHACRCGRSSIGI